MRGYWKENKQGAGPLPGIGCSKREKTLCLGVHLPGDTQSREGYEAGVGLSWSWTWLLDHTLHIMAALNKQAREEMHFHLHCCCVDPQALWEGTVGGQKYTGGGHRGPGGQRWWPKGTYKDTESDRKGRHGSTSQLNLTISLPRESPLCHFCPPFRNL